jgi:hypothetical protein
MLTAGERRPPRSNRSSYGTSVTAHLFKIIQYAKKLLPPRIFVPLLEFAAAILLHILIKRKRVYGHPQGFLAPQSIYSRKLRELLALAR